VPFGAALADDDIAGDDFFAAEFLYAESRCIGVATRFLAAVCIFFGQFFWGPV
jgi:hypothetical protein